MNNFKKLLIFFISSLVFLGIISTEALSLNPEDINLQPFNPNHPYNNAKLPIEERVNDLLSRMSLREKALLLSGAEHMRTKRNNRLHIPAMKVTDGPHGVGSGSMSTCFPTGVSLASTWDEDLIYNVGVALGQETRGQGKHILLGPCVGIHRTPLGGRNFESFSEDPYLASRITAAYVKGVQSQRIGTSTKHYACNNQEYERFTISTEIDERTLREIYLPAFKAAVKEAHTLSIMGAYNKVNDLYCCENKHLLNDILNEWGFKGFVVSDWGAVHSTVKTLNAGCDLEMPGPGKFLTESRVLIAVKRGDVGEETIDDRVRRTLRAMFWLGLFDKPNPKYKGAVDTPEHRKLARWVAENAIVLMKNDGNLLPLDMKKIKSIAVIGPNAAVARLGGGGSSTVHPPYSVSPLEGLKKKCQGKVPVRYTKGSGMIADLKDIPVKLLKPAGSGKDVYGLKGEYFNNRDFRGKPAFTRIDEKIGFNWEGNSPAPQVERDNFSVRWKGKFTPLESKKYILGLTSDDGSRLYIDNKLFIDNWGDHGEVNVKQSIYLKAGHSYDIRIEYYDAGGGAIMKFGETLPNKLMLKEAIEAAKKSDVAIIFAGIDANIEGEGCDKKTLLLPEGQDRLIKEIAEVNKKTIVVLINGTPVLMDKWIDKVPAILEAWYPGQEGGNAIANVLFGDVNPSGKMPYTFPGRYEDVASSENYPGENGKVHYKDGIFVGYRHFDKNNIEPLFAFGHGLSYTEFKYSNLQINPKEDISSYPIEVSFDIKNIGKRKGKEVAQLYIRDVKSSLERPEKELKAFRKVNLNPGQAKKVTFKLNKDALAFYDPAKKSWVVEPGEFEVFLGSSSRDIKLSGTFILK